jgi:pentatricopeptide repeat protein
MAFPMNFKPFFFIRFFAFLAVASISWSGNFKTCTTLSAFAQEANDEFQTDKIGIIGNMLNQDGYLQLNDDEKEEILETLRKAEVNLLEREKQKISEYQKDNHISAWNELCHSYSIIGLWELAVKACERSFNLAVENLPRHNSEKAPIWEPSELSSSSWRLADAYIAVQDNNKAVQHINRYIEIAGKFSWSLPAEVLARAYFNAGKYEEAVKYYRQVLESDIPQNSNNNEPRIPKGKTELGLSLVKNGNLPEAEQELMAALESVEKHRNALYTSQTLFSSQMQNIESSDFGPNESDDGYYQLYTSIQELRVKQGKHEEALEFAERGRTNALSQRLSKANTPPKITITQMRAIAKEQKATLVEYSHIYAPDYGSTHRYRLFIWVVQPNGQIHFRQVDPNSFTKQIINTPSKSIISLLFVTTGIGLALFLLFVKRRKNIALLVMIISLIGSYSHTFVASGQKEQPSTTNVIDAPSTLVKDTLIAIKGEAQGNISKFQTQRTCKNREACLRQLNQLLIEPIKDLLPRNSEEQVIFIPDLTLLQVPFAALQDSEGKYLIEKHTILTTPSIRILHLLNQHQRNRQNFNLATKALVVGNPVIPPKVKINVDVPDVPDRYVTFANLPSAETEAKAVAQLLNTKAIIGEEATESLVVREIPQAKIIHLATHGDLRIGVFHDTGALLLTSLNKNKQSDISINPDDGLLNPDEIYRLNLSAELVVMSACETGLGIETTDGVIGLVRPFLAGGVPTVIASLWTIPDAPTSELMVDFYKNLQANPDKAQALRQAMLTTMKKHPKPFNWAAFTLVGEAK